jgi:hypothetical protein
MIAGRLTRKVGMLTIMWIILGNTGISPAKSARITFGESKAVAPSAAQSLGGYT